jgi:hypothetical protein
VARVLQGLVRRARTAVGSVRRERVRAVAWLQFRRRRRRYRILGEGELRAGRKSDTVFVFGSGASLNEIAPAEWSFFEAHDTIGFNWFVRQDFVRADYHLVRGIPADDLRPASWRPVLERYFAYARHSPRYAATTFVVHTGWNAINGNRAIGLGLLPAGRPVFLYRSRLGQPDFSWSFADGLAHPNSTLEDTVNFAVLAGWTRIVLVGVDLYDRRYFWLAPEETLPEDVARGASADDAHSRAASGMLETFDRWTRDLAGRGIELAVYNPRSLLADIMPVFSAKRANGPAGRESAPSH